MSSPLFLRELKVGQLTGWTHGAQFLREHSISSSGTLLSLLPRTYLSPGSDGQAVAADEKVSPMRTATPGLLGRVQTAALPVSLL